MVDSVYWAERGADGHAGLGAAELLTPSEVVLAAGEEYAAPPLFAVYSPAGLDGLTACYHRYVCDRPAHPRAARPVVLNTWEAVYFDHRLDRLTGLADVAARLGVERFVLDDGWFRHRRDDTAGLGDWYVAEDVWPRGLAPLIEHVRSLGMEFGLWVEPEMVNPDSDLFRAHPDWVLSEAGRLPPAWRHQQVLDLANPACYAYLRDRLDGLLAGHDIAFLKWDHNRDLIEAGHAGRPGVHAQTLAVYRLLDELRERHPAVEIESCASGGGRVDLGILARTDRVWASDTNDALERQAIQRWTQLLLPPELVGAHVGPPARTPPAAPTPWRSASRSRSSATSASSGTSPRRRPGSSRRSPRRSASTGGCGRSCTAARWCAPTIPTPPPTCTGSWPATAPRPCSPTCSSPRRRSRSRERPGCPAWTRIAPTASCPWPSPACPRPNHATPPRWYEAGGVTLTGRALAEAGLQLPVLLPEQALLLHLTHT